MSEKPSVSTELRFDFYSSGHDTFYQTEVDRLGLKEVVNFLPGIPYDQIIQRMAEADILLLFQGGSCNEQIPAKAYEYLRIGKPILTLAPASSATAGLVMEASAGEVVNPDDPGKIARVLGDWTERYLSDQPLPIPDRFVVDGYSRRNQTKVLANAISEVVDSDED
jgi:glycosyltransferase involved in cell wall biosynthesis